MTSIDTLDINSLSKYLRDRLPDLKDDIQAEKFAGGQSNPTFLLTSGARKLVLRRKPPGKLLKSAHAVDREFKVLNALSKTEIPVARPLLLCEDDDVIGSMFFVMSFEDGVVYWDPALLELPREDRRLVYSALTRTLATLHSVDVDTVGLGDFGKKGGYFDRQFYRWKKQYRAAQTADYDSVERLIAWLGDNLPEDDGQVGLIHGDYRIDNAIFHRDRYEVRALLDWELSTLGHPTADLAYFCMSLRLPGSELIPGVGLLDREELGVPSEEEIIRDYCRFRGIDGVSDWTFALALSFFRYSSIAQGIYSRALAGNASNKNALSVIKAVEPICRLALDTLDIDA